MKFATWNVRSLYRLVALQETMDELTRYRVDLCALQEIRWPNKGILNKKNGALFYSGSTDRRNLYGTGIFVSRALSSRVTDFQAVSPRICKIRINMEPHNITAISVHAPTEEREEEEKMDFYADLEKTYDEAPSFDMKIILGDFNGKIGKERIYHPTTGRHSLHDNTSSNGTKLIEFATAKEMVISSTYFPHKRIHKGTWKSPDGRIVNQIDHMLVDKRYASHIIDVKTKRGANVDSDHFLVTAKVRTKIAHRRRKPEEPKTKIWNSERLKDEETRGRFEELVEDKLRSSEWNQEENTECLWEKLKTSILHTAEEVLGEKPRRPRDQWFDEECVEAIKRKNHARQRLISNGTRGREEEYREARRRAKRLLRGKKRLHYREKLKHLEQEGRNGGNGRSKKFFKEVKEAKAIFTPQCKFIRTANGTLAMDQEAIMQAWVEHFANVFTGEKDNMEIGQAMEQGDENFKLLPSLEDVMGAVRARKNDKAPGIDAITGEMLKSAGNTAHEILHRIVKIIWQIRGTPPGDWTIGIINPIPKKGDITICQNYRAITLLCTAYKVTTSILRKKLDSIYGQALGEYQSGFRKDRATTDQLFTMRCTLEKLWEYNIPSYHLFVDFRTAYDSIIRGEMWKALEELGVPEELIRVCRLVITESKGKIRVNGKTSETLRIDRGVRQGDGLAPTLFNLVLEAVMRRANIRRNATLLHHSYQILGYADDLDIAGRSLKAVKETFEAIEVKAKKVGLEVNAEKTKFMVVSRYQNAGKNIGKTLNLGQYSFEVVKEFTYLGSVISSENNESLEIGKRIVKANRAYFSLTPLLRSKELSRKIKVIIYKTLIRPIIMYGSECWALKQADGARLGTFERKILRRIFGANKVGENEYRRKRNDELYELFGDIDVMAHIRSGRLRWLGHVSRMEEHNPCKRILFGNIHGGRPRGRPRNRWWNAVMDDLKLLRLRDWKSVAGDRDSWRTILYEAKDLFWSVEP